jgi:hypothetical protein
MEVTSDPETAKMCAAERAAVPNPLMYRIDELGNSQLRLECSRALHRIAGRLGFSCLPKRSYINRGTYYAEINAHRPTGQVYADAPDIQKSMIVPNVAFGTGNSPLEAAMNGYRRIISHPAMDAVLLECELYLLGEAVRRAKKIDAALDGLVEALHLLTVRMAQAAHAAHEDDDL